MPEITYRLSDGTRAGIATLIEARIAREYGQTAIDGQDVALVESGARMLVEAGLHFDARPAFLAFAKGDERGLNGWVDSEIRILLKEGLAARECQCRQLAHGGLDRNHGHRDTCHRHYEADVPPIDGLLLCGTCHGAEYQARR